MFCSRNSRFFNRVLLLFFTGLFFYTCERLDIVEVAKIVTLSVEYPSADTAVGYGNLIDDGGVSFIERGMCWDTSPNPTIYVHHQPSENPTNPFSCILRELQPGTEYHARAYTRNGDDITYGNDVLFTTKEGKPVIATMRITDVTTNSALVVSTIEDDGGYRIVSRGVCWSSGENPTVEDGSTTDGSGLGSYTSTIKDLVMGAYYYVRAYARNTHGDVHYGNLQLFRTVPDGIDAVFEKLEAGLAPVIDGSEEDLWNNVSPVRIEKTFQGETPTVTAYWKGMYDDTCLFVIVNVEDEDHYPRWEAPTGEVFDFDRVELYFDLNDNLEDGQGPDHANSGHWQAPVEIWWSDNYTRENYRSWTNGQLVSNYQSYKLNGENCTYEFRIPMHFLKDENATPFTAKNLMEKVFGFDITVPDQDKGRTTSRQRKAWMNNLDGPGYESWYDMDKAGKIAFR